MSRRVLNQRFLKCDRCQLEVEEEPGWGIVELGLITDDRRHFDVCPSCSDGLRGFLKNAGVAPRGYEDEV